MSATQCQCQATNKFLKLLSGSCLFSTLLSIPVMKLESMRILARAFSEKTVHFEVQSGGLLTETLVPESTPSVFETLLDEC